jgi:hypothetical protein
MGSHERPCPDDSEAVLHLKRALASGKHWYIALLEAIGLWTEGEECCDDRQYTYLVGGEAFDWLLLAERLTGTVSDLIPEAERLELLFHGRPPLKLKREEFRRLIGAAKYRQYLNYFYGITVEEALLQAVCDEVRKEKRISANLNDGDLPNEAYQRLYGGTRTALLKRFRQQTGRPLRRSASLSELKEFTYWLFKYRLEHSDRAKVASDTKRALEKLAADGLPGLS